MEWAAENFEHFLPDHDWEPDINLACADWQGTLYVRIRKCLDRLESSNLPELVSALDALILSWDSIDQRIERLKSEFVDQENPIYREWRTYYGQTVAEWLIFADMAGDKIDQLKPSVTMSEVFAIAALNGLGDAIEQINRMREKTSNWEDHRHWHGQYLSLDTANFFLREVEGITSFAERLGNPAGTFAANIDTQLQLKISQQNSDAASKRHRPGNELKSEFAREYTLLIESGEKITKSQAARRFFRRLPDEKKALIVRNPSHENATEKAVRNLLAYRVKPAT